MDSRRIAIWGYGNMGKRIVELLMMDKNPPILIIDNNANTIRLSKEMEKVGEKITIVHPDVAGEILDELRPDACIIATRSIMKDLKSQYEVCAKCGVSAISIGEESIYPWKTSPNITEYLDKIAKDNNVTLAGSGFQDIYWGHLVATLSKSMFRFDKIVGRCQYNIADYGRALREAHGVGLSLEEFRDKMVTYPRCEDPPYSWNGCQYLASILGLEIKDISHTFEPVSNNGVIIGLNSKVMIVAIDGISHEHKVIELSNIGKIYNDGDVDFNIWTLYGVPEKLTIKMEGDGANIVDLTCSAVVNRIKEIKNYPYGFVTFDRKF